MTLLFENDKTNSTCLLSLLWSPSAIDSQRPALYVCIIATITHSMFWLQFILYPCIRKKSIQWIYAYLITDILLVFRFFFVFIVHATSNECVHNRIWSLFVCYFEAVIDNYLNTLEVYILLALNLCRYIQITQNRNVYTTYKKSLICTHLFIYLIPLIMYIIQLYTGWAQIKEYANESCDTVYTNMDAQIFNIIMTFALPIILNILVIYASIRHIHLKSRLHQSQHYISAREKYHRSLVIQFFIFYIVWLVLWSPNIIIFQLEIKNNSLMIMMQLLNYIEITLDPIIISALDARLQQVWYKSWTCLTKRLAVRPNHNHRRIQPNTVTANLQIRHHIIETNL